MEVKIKMRRSMDSVHHRCGRRTHLVRLRCREVVVRATTRAGGPGPTSSRHGVNIFWRGQPATFTSVHRAHGLVQGSLQSRMSKSGPKHVPGWSTPEAGDYIYADLVSGEAVPSHVSRWHRAQRQAVHQEGQGADRWTQAFNTAPKKLQRPRTRLHGQSRNDCPMNEWRMVCSTTP